MISLVNIAQLTSRAATACFAAVLSYSISIIAYQLLSRSASQDRFDPTGDIPDRAEIDACVATKSL